jgi:outer membrane protein
MKYFFILIIFFANFTFSQDLLTLEKAIEYGLTNSHDIAIIKNDATIIKNINHIGAAGVLPNITISSGYNGAINNSELDFNSFLSFGEDMDSSIDATQAKSVNISSSIGLSYRLFNGFNGIYTLRKFEKQNNIADENTRYQIELKILDIIKQYYDMLNRKHIYNTFKISHQISLERYNQALERHNLGAISKINLLNAEVNLNQDKVQMEESLIKLRESELNLKLILGTPDLSFDLQHEFNFNQNLDIETLLKQTFSNNTSIIIAELNYSVAKDELKISKSNFSPSIDLFSSYSYNNRKSETSFISEQKDNGVIAGINVEIPIFSSNMRRKNFQNAKINLDSKNHSLEHIKETIKTALLNAYYNYSENLNNLVLMKSNLETIEKTANINKELYDLGQISNLEYRESQILLDQAEISYNSKLSQTKIQEYIIYQLSGQLQSK